MGVAAKSRIKVIKYQRRKIIKLSLVLRWKQVDRHCRTFQGAVHRLINGNRIDRFIYEVPDKERFGSNR